MSIFDKKRCLCGIHVNPATEIIAIIHIAFYFFFTIVGCLYMIRKSSITFDLFIIFCILEILSSGLLLLGKIKSYTTCYLPFIILHVIFYIITILFAIRGLVIWINGNDPNYDNRFERVIRDILIFTILSIVYTYILSIVIRSRILKEQANTRPAPENLIELIS